MANKEYYEDNEIMEVPGFRFYPTEEELISFYLQQKLHGGRPDIDRVIPVVYIYDYNPWDLPKLSGDGCKSDPQLQEWFFFIPKHKKEAAGGRPNRLTGNGYWKATGSPGYVYSSTDNKMIGLKRTMVFYNGRARSRSGSKTDWKMNEYIAASSTNHIQKGDFTVCRVYKKSKCLRAFDRRPGAPPPIIGRPVLNHQLDHHDHQPSSSTDHHHHHQNLTSRVEIVRFITSESSSSSRDLSNNNNNNNNNNNISNNNNNILLSQGYNNNNYEQPNVTVWDDCDWDWTMMNWNF